MLVAGLCRIFYQDGLRTAPFKSQNMALNSGITPDGKEMGRAQIFQAEARGDHARCAYEPGAAQTDQRSPGAGRADGESGGPIWMRLVTMTINPRLREQILAVYNSLAQEYDVIVLEGAGSPAEINLRDRDIVQYGNGGNGPVSGYSGGRISTGAAYSPLFMARWRCCIKQERDRVKGVIINKFRGDVALLYSGIEQIESLTGVPVLGVMPWLDVDLEDEDGVALQKR
ncbi:cobyric acid synthase [Salmonella enterica subsp. enterica]|uniref:Cobyric acid synthase n=1 Tax=Salmonella enterica I TaxID=59201 RepID=A0A447U0V3_SALET|nr:cobyric acid synthase [Salmonella enterica subsp. enterica]